MKGTKEKAKELVDSFWEITTNLNLIDFGKDRAKHCSIICVDEILKAVTTIADKKYDYWTEVKREIELL